MTETSPDNGKFSDDNERTLGKQPRDEKMYTGETLETPEGLRTPQQMNIGRENEEGGGEWPDPNAPPQPPAPGADA